MKVKIKYLVFIVIGVVIFYLYPFVKKIYHAEANNLTVEKNLYDGYIGLLKSFDKNKIDMNSLFTYYYKETAPISIFKYDSLYSILIYKLEGRNLNSLDSCFVFLNISTKESLGMAYNGVESSYNFKFEANKFPTLHTIIFSLFGDSIKVIEKNDSLVCYSANFSNYSIRSAQSTAICVYGNTIMHKKTPFSILFLKRGSTVYLLTMTQNDANNKRFPTKFLLNLIDSNHAVRLVPQGKSKDS